MATPTGSAPIRIVADVRERRSQTCALLAAQPGVELEFAPFELGDYQLSDEVMVERKTAWNLASSIRDRRLFGRAIQLGQRYRRPVLLIEGDPIDPSTGVAPDTVYRALSFVAVSLGIPVLQVPGPEQAAKMLRSMARRAARGPDHPVELRPSKPATARLLAEYLVQGLPGIGALRARQLLGHFGTARRMLSATRAELIEVPGIGPVLADRIVEVLEAWFDPAPR